MNEMQRLVRVAEIAKGLEDPGRQEEAFRYHGVVIEALNATHKNGEQDALCVYEGLAHVLAQLTANLDDNSRQGVLEFVRVRAGILAPVYGEEGKGASKRFDGLH